MIDLKKNPKLLPTAPSGTICTLDGDQFTFERIYGGICLTSVDSRVNDFHLTESYEGSYESNIRHVRIQGRALLGINELLESILANTYTIDAFKTT